MISFRIIKPVIVFCGMKNKLTYTGETDLKIGTYSVFLNAY